MRNRSSAAPSKASPQQTAHLLDWEFRRGGDRVSCVIDRDQCSGEFGVALVKNRERAPRAPIEKFERMVGALTCHATLASHLRDTGWTRVLYTV
jgi:hypothetical protein